MSNDPEVHERPLTVIACDPETEAGERPVSGQMSSFASGPAGHPGEPHTDRLGARLNWLRAGVLGANDGIVSVAGLVVGVAGAAVARGPIFTAGLAGLVAGAVSMALGEYVSVSSQRDTELAARAKEERELSEEPEAELAELVTLYQGKGLSLETARAVAIELTAHDALAAHLEVELGLDTAEVTSPTSAAVASAVSFLLGALLPLLAILIPPPQWRVLITVVAVLAALALTATISARLSGANLRRVLPRVVLGGGIGLAVTYGIGHVFGAALS
jgi:VIT1/CCC1 family predicted Fe2+/Mn2+ transporter